jgi:hypothetical protein
VAFERRAYHREHTDIYDRQVVGQILMAQTVMSPYAQKYLAKVNRITPLPDVEVIERVAELQHSAMKWESVP